MPGKVAHMFATIRQAAVSAFVAVMSLAAPAGALAADAIHDAPLMKGAETAVAASSSNLGSAVLEHASIVPASVQIQDTNVSRGDSVLTTARRSLYAAFAVTQLLDADSTLKVLRHNGVEANPLMKATTSSATRLYAVKAATVGATVFFAERFGRHSPVTTFFIMAGLNSGYAMIAARNYQIAKRLP